MVAITMWISIVAALNWCKYWLQISNVENSYYFFYVNYLPKSRPLNFFKYIENFENNIQILNIIEFNIKLMGINYSTTQDQVQHKQQHKSKSDDSSDDFSQL